MLAHNGGNRKMRMTGVEFLTRAMREGQFLTTHEGIAFDTEGSLIDGQHRLRAIIASGTRQWMLVVKNLEPEVFNVIDAGITRTMSDRLRVNPKIASVASTMFRVVLGDSKRVATYEVQTIIDSLGAEIDTVLGFSTKNTARACLVAAAALRLAMHRKMPVELDRTTELVESFFKGVTRDMPETRLSQFYDYIVKTKSYGTRVEATLFRRTWEMISPYRDSKTMQVTEDTLRVAGVVASAAFHDVTAGNFKA